MGNDIEITVKVSNATSTGFASVNRSLGTLKDKAENASQALRTLSTRTTAAGLGMRALSRDTDGARRALTELHAAATDIDVKATLDDRTATGAADVAQSLADLRALAADIPVTIDDRTGPGAAAVTQTMADLRSLAGDIPITLDDRTAADFASITARLDDLKSAGRTEIAVTVDDQTATAFAAITAQLDDLRTKSAQITVDLEDKTAADFAAITARLDDLRAASAQIAISVDDQTGPGIDAVKLSLDDLKAHSPIRLDMTFDGQVADITAAAAAMGDLKNDAQGTSRAMTTLTTKATAAAAALELLKQAAESASRAIRGLGVNAAATAVALGELRARATAAAGSLRTLATRTGNADGRMGDLSGRTRTLRGDMDDLDNVLARVAGNMGNLRGRLGTVSTSSGSAGGAMNKLLRTALLLSPALLPIAASTVPVAQGLGAATVGVAAFAAAVIPQIKSMGELSKAHDKYGAAVAKSGAGSQQAAQAEGAYLGVVESMTPATRQASAAFGLLKTAFQGWSDSLSSSTMPVFTKAFAAFRAMLPSFTPLVSGAAGQLDRLVTLMAGGVKSNAFDGLMQRFSEFSTGALKGATDGLVTFLRRLSSGDFSSTGLHSFMEYARANGPLVADTFRNLGSAIAKILSAASGAGVSLLGIVNAFAKLVSAIPTSLLSTLLQVYTTFKLISLAGSGFVAAAGGVRALTRQLVVMRGAATTAGGGMAGLRAAFMGLSTAGKLGVVAGGITALALVLVKLSSIGKAAPPDIDKLTTSLGQLGRSGKTSGEAARVFGRDLDGLYKSVRSFADPSTTDKVQQGLVKVFSLGMADSTPHKEAKKNLDAIDKSLSNLVKGGKADLAAAAVERLKKAYASGGHNVKDFSSRLDDYKSALADAAFEQQLAADAQGLFGQQALATSKALAAQKQSADGLRGAIQALNDVQRQGLGGMIGFEAAIDAAAKAAKKNAGALSMSHGELDLGSEKARNAASALQDLASKTDEAAGSARESGASWSRVNAIYERGRAELMKSAQTMGLTRTQARALANEILKTPSKAMMLKADISDLSKKIAEAKKKLGDKSLSAGKRAKLTADINDWKSKIGTAERALRNMKDSKIAHLKGNISDWQRKISQAKAQLKSAPSSKTAALRANIADLQRKVASARSQIASIRGKTVNITTVLNTIRGKSVHDVVGATGGLFTGNAFKRGYAEGGLVQGPGTETSDDVPAPWLSKNEFVVNARSARKHRRLLEAINADRLREVGLRRGGSLSKAEREAARQASGDLSISHFGRMAGYKNDEFRSALGKPSDMSSLVNALNQWRGVIKQATHGGTEKRLLHQLDQAGKSLIKNAKLHDKVSDALGKAKDKLSSLKDAAAQMRDSVSSGVIQSGNITNAAQSGEGHVTVGGIMGGLRASRDKATAFAGALKALRKKGLSKEAIAQIAQAGIEGGGLETAEALMRASGSEIKDMNKYQAQIKKAAKSAGKTTADAMYAGGIKAAEGMVKGLEKQKKKLEQIMLDIAKGMEKAIKKALHIKGKATGGVIGAAAGGVRSAMTWVGEQGPELVDLPYGSRVRSAGDSRRIAAGGGQSIPPIQVVLTLDGKVVARELIDPLRGEIWSLSGGNVQAALGRR